MSDDRCQLDDAGLDSETVLKIARLSPVPLAVSRVEDGRFLEASDSFLAMLGYARDELIGRTLQELNLWADPDGRATLVERVRQAGAVSGLRLGFRTRDGVAGIGQVSAYTVRLGPGLCLVTMAEDITEKMRTERAQSVARAELAEHEAQRTRELTETNDRLEREIVARSRAEAELLLSRERWRSLASTAADTIIIADADGIVLDMNRAGRGRRVGDLVGTSVYGLFPQECDEPLRETVREVLRSGRTRTVQLTGFDADRNRTWYRARVGPYYSNESIVGVTIFVADINSAKLGEQKLLAEEALLRRLLDLQDRERRLVACEIHDGLLQDIVGAHLLAQSLDGAATLAAIERLLVKAMNEGRRLISELRPMILDERGLVDAIEFLAEEEEAKGIHVDFVHRTNGRRLPPLLEQTLFRIVQEAVTNARRHGLVPSVSVRLTMVDDNHVVVEIHDRGVGFDPASVPVERFGLSGIRERARLFGGGASIESVEGVGTRVTVKIPLELPVADVSEKKSKPWRWTV